MQRSVPESEKSVSNSFPRVDTTLGSQKGR